MGSRERSWRSGDQHTIPGTLLGRLESDPDGEYLDVNGTKMTRGGGVVDGEPGGERAARPGRRAGTIVWRR